MHLPPLDVAVYPVVTMSHGRHGGSSTQPTSNGSSSTAMSAVSSSTCTSPNFSSIQKAIRSVFRSSKITVQQVERLQGRLHQIFLTRLADGSYLVLKCTPSYNTRILRHEKHGLETERRTLETLREYTSLSVPQVIKYDSQGGSLGTPYLMMSHIPGRRLSELSAYLSASERQVIDRTLGGYVRILTGLSATQFGTTNRVLSKRGYSSWREAFVALLEAVLRDGEDMLVTIPYDSIRYYVGRHTQSLDEVTESRLVALNACEPENVLLDPQTKQVTGLVGFTEVIWGDPLMSGGIANGSDAFFQGYGERPARSGAVWARQLMYTTYKATVQIVAHYYRSHLTSDDMEARRSLTYALNELARM